jgi:carbonic anhydrase
VQTLIEHFYMKEPLMRNGLLARIERSQRWAGVAALALCVAGCDMQGHTTGNEDWSKTFDKAAQTSVTPDAALTMLVEGNKRFVGGQSRQRDSLAQVKATAKGQYPYAVVLSCIDSRLPPEVIFDQGVGDIFVARVAGNYAPVDMLGSMEFATKVAGAKLVVVLGHTECGAVKGACDDVELGNLTTVIQAIRPAVEEVKGVDGPRTSKNPPFVLAATVSNVRRTIAVIRARSEILREMEQAGEIRIVGGMFDMQSGEVTLLK